MNQSFSMIAALLGPSRRTTGSRGRPVAGACPAAFARRAGRRGFTLIELLAVVIIIGIILSFVFVAGMDAIRRSEERATQTLIAKLEGGLNDRLEALLETRPDYNSAHVMLGQIYNGGNTLPGIARAQVIAWLDYVKSEMPDTFYIQTGFDANYPLNFTGNSYPLTNATFTTNPYPYVLPIGQPDVYVASLTNPLLNSPLPVTGTGVYGASYPAAAGAYKNLGYTPTGYDGIDNNGNNMVDEMAEGVSHGPPWTADPDVVAKVNGHLASHRHVTARAEMLYALLVEGSGPLGSIFSPDEFTAREVQDTDGDGMPEFVDAWGHPIQFFRWPLLYSSDIQRGQVVGPSAVNNFGTGWQLNAPYLQVFETREQDALDPNQQLVAPAWWTASFNDSYPFTLSTGANYTGMTPTPSFGVKAIEYFFHRVTEPLRVPNQNPGTYWDRGNTYASRRAFYSKFLVLSGGPDQTLGVFLYPDTFFTGVTSTSPSIALIANENNALPFSIHDVVDFTTSATIPSLLSIPVNTTNPSSNDPTNPSSYDLQQAAQDDISNQNLSAVSHIGGSG
jgi:prepilin-type N-terminal cleavage/methylation domain-containing protein